MNEGLEATDHSHERAEESDYFGIGNHIRDDPWAVAHKALITALKNARDVGGIAEEEALSAVEDVYHEADEHYESP